MKKLLSSVRKFIVAEEAATMVEYGLMIALIAAFLIVTVQTLATNIKTKFTNVATAVGGA